MLIKETSQSQYTPFQGKIFLRGTLFWPVLFLLSFLASGCATMGREKSAFLNQQAAMVSSQVPPENDEVLWNNVFQPYDAFCPIQAKHPDIDTDQDWSEPEPESTLAQEISELEKLGSWEEGESPPMSEFPPKKKIFPITINRQVEYYLDFFQHREPETFGRWLSRSGRYLPLIEEKLEAAGLPLELAYLPLIESGFNLTAYSRAHAVGPWQFIKATGRHYGLKIDNYVDERRDIAASTDAAIQFLTELYEEFDSWYLAVAGYNAGAGTIRSAIRRAGTNNFWKIAQTRYLRAETKLYVPKLIAAILIARDPERYGFSDISYQEPLGFDSVEVPPWTALQAVAVAADIDFDELVELNRDLRKNLTPPNNPHLLKVPVGKKRLVAENLDRVKAVVKTTYQTHTVGARESIATICRHYNLNTLTLMKANDLWKSKLSAGQRLRIPVQITEYRLLDEYRLAAETGASEDGLILHRIRPGETLSTISSKYHVPVYQIAAWNDIKNFHSIRAGRQLALYLDNSPLAEDNANAQATQGKTLSVTYYQVRRGDSLWKIARKYRLTTDQIRQWNNLENDKIKPGHRLLLRLAEDEDA
jgi:membrane-bound lytic murein transglycosylase D